MPSIAEVFSKNTIGNPMKNAKKKFLHCRCAKLVYTTSEDDINNIQRPPQNVLSVVQALGKKLS